MSTYNRNLFDGIYMQSLAGEFKPLKIGIDINKTNIKVPMPKKTIINHGATVLIWDNGEKTIVKRCENDEFNKKLGFLTAFFQHYCGMSKNKANKFLAELEVEDEETEEQKTVEIKSSDEDLKVGDKVRVRKNLRIYEVYGGQSFVNSMEQYKGEIVTIERIIRPTEYEIREDNGHWIWTKEMFENKQPKHMKGEIKW